jgi:hypothetical protein
MAVYQRDEYAESQRRGGAGALAWLVWVVATLVGIFVARVVALGLDQAEQFSGPLYIAYLLARGAVVGAILGAAQGVVFLFYGKRIAWPQWILATAVGWAARSLVLFLISDGLLNLARSLAEPGMVAAVALTGLAVGAALAIPQAYMLKRYIDHPVWWVWVSAGAYLVGRAAAGLGFTSGLIDGAAALIVVEVTLASAITGIALTDMLRDMRVPDEDDASPIVEPLEATPQPLVHPLGQDVELAPGLYLTFYHAEISESSIIWRGTANNIKGTPASLPLTAAMASVSDSTQKPYSVSNLAISNTEVPAGASAEVVITATVLPFSPVPEGATYLDLTLDRDGLAPIVFRRPL